MEYDRIRQAIFLNRPNRFIAEIEVDGQVRACHVKNTGRCRELLLPGAGILVQQVDSQQRKTAFDLIAVWKGQRLINMDAAAPNQIFAEWLPQSGLLPGLSLVRPECAFGQSRFDIYLEAGPCRAFAEIKGVTLEENGVVRFPDAPTARGVKHLQGLTECVAQGYTAFAVFIVQMESVRYFEPNWQTHPAFGAALQAAQQAGVTLLALDCHVWETGIAARRPVEIRL